MKANVLKMFAEHIQLFNEQIVRMFYCEDLLKTVSFISGCPVFWKSTKSSAR